MIEIQYDDGGLGRDLDAAARRFGNLRPLMATLGGELARRVRGHFLRRDREPNRRGWPKRGFWAREGAANTSLAKVTGTSATVAVASPAIAHRQKGGTVRAKRGRLLAIPATAEAYAAGSPREKRMDGLFLVRRRGAVKRGSGMFLAQQQGTALRVQYFLVPHATHAKDPRTLPDVRAESAHLQRTAARWVERQLAHGRNRGAA